MRIQRRGSVNSLLNYSFYAVIFLTAMSFLLNSTMLLPTPIGVITSGSMKPTINTGDVVFVQPAAIEEVKVGDIIAFYSPPDEKTVIHRVTRVIQVGKIYLRTKGDNEKTNPVEDQEVGGWIGVDSRRLIGKVYCLDGHPLRIPLLGLLIIKAKNFSIWLTQNKIWSFWAPMLAILFIFGPYLTPGGVEQFDLRKSLKVKIPTERLFIYSLLAMFAISGFTIYFRTETYTLTMRVASLVEPWRGYIYYGSMIYGETRNNTVTVSGAPLFPVKTFVWIKGNASKLVRPIPSAAKIEPNTLNDLVLQASIPARGEVDPGPYEGMVYIFSDTLLLLLPEEVIFAVLSIIPNPWVAVVFLDVLMAFMLASLLAFVVMAINWSSSQILYTLVWRDKLKTGLSTLRLKIHRFRKKMGVLWRIITKIGRLSRVLKKDVELKGMLKLVCMAIVPATTLFLLRDNVLLPVITLGVALGILVKNERRERSEMVFGGALANLLFSVIFITRYAVVFLYSSVNPYWSMISASFVGNVSNLITLPIALFVTLLSAFGLEFARTWYMEQQTSGWQILKSKITVERTISIPSIERFEGKEKRRLTVEEIRGVSIGAVSALKNKVKTGLSQLLRGMSKLLSTIRNEARVTTQHLRGRNTKLVDIERWFITLINGVKSKASSLKGGVNRIIENSWWLLRLLGFELKSRVKRLGGF